MRASAALDGLTTQTQATLDQLRELARGIFPQLLADRGLVPALEAQMRKGEAHVPIDADSRLAAARYDPGIEAAVYFALVEALRRATSSTIIRLVADGDELRFSVDGLANAFHGDMQESQDRIAAAGGSLDVDSRLGGGTTVRGRVPMSAVVGS